MSEKHTLYMREWRKKNLEKNRQYYRDYHVRNKKREKELRGSDKQRAVLRDWQLRTKYGISLKDYKNMWTEQEGKCKICGKYKPIDGKTIEKLCVDHNHESGKIRGLICFNCNAAIGHFQEDIELLKKAIVYMTEEKTYLPLQLLIV